MTRTLLAIESSTDWLSVALLRGAEVIGLEEASDAGRRHVSELLPAIDRLLRRSRTRLDRLDAIGISTGPGSFTSLRIGLATAKGLGLGRPIEAVGVSTLEAMAWSLFEDGPGAPVGSQIVALLDARRGEWYAGGWAPAHRDGELPTAMLAEGLYSPEALVDDLGGVEVSVVTPMAPRWRDAFQGGRLALARVIEGRAGRPRADRVGRIAQLRLDRGEGDSVGRLVARYLRRAEAEATRLGGPVEEGEVDRAHSDRASPHAGARRKGRVISRS